MSSSAFHQIVQDGFHKDGPQKCQLPHAEGNEVKFYPSEDLQMSKCAQLLNIHIYNSQIDGQTTFFPFPFERHLVKSLAMEWWLTRTEECVSFNINEENSLMSFIQPSLSSHCVSPYVISMHYVKPHMMYILQFFTEVFRRD